MAHATRSPTKREMLRQKHFKRVNNELKRLSKMHNFTERVHNYLQITQEFLSIKKGTNKVADLEAIMTRPMST